MRTKTRTPVRTLVLFGMGVVFVLLALAILQAVGTLTLPGLNGHAREKHHHDAVRAWEYVQGRGIDGPSASCVAEAKTSLMLG